VNSASVEGTNSTGTALARVAQLSQAAVQRLLPLFQQEAASTRPAELVRLVAVHISADPSYAAPAMSASQLRHGLSLLLPPTAEASGLAVAPTAPLLHQAVATGEDEHAVSHSVGALEVLKACAAHRPDVFDGTDEISALVAPALRATLQHTLSHTLLIDALATALGLARRGALPKPVLASLLRPLRRALCALPACAEVKQVCRKLGDDEAGSRPALHARLLGMPDEEYERLLFEESSTEADLEHETFWLELEL